MDALRFHHHTSEQNLDELKFILLYFDKIEIPVFLSTYIQRVENQKAYRCLIENYSATEQYLRHVKILEDEGIVTLDQIKYKTHTGKNGLNLLSAPHGIGEFVGKNLVRFFQNPIIQKTLNGTDYSGDLIPELKRYHDEIDTNTSVTGISRFYSSAFGVTYTIAQIDSILSDINSGRPTLNGSPFLDNFVRDFLFSSGLSDIQAKLKRQSNIEARISIDAIKLALPNISHLSFEDILEIRHVMRDELVAFQSEIKHLSISFDAERFSHPKELSEYVLSHINTKVASIERKLKTLNRGVLKSAIKEVKDPKSYSPLLLSFFDSVSNSLILLFSLGIISFDVIVDYLERKEEVQKDGLYFLAKLKNKKY